MKPFGDALTLAKNSRGCYILDTVKGCSIVNTRSGGCYGDCYAVNIAKRYRLDFGSPVLRRILDDRHRASLVRQMTKAPVEFIRIGEMGDPSEDWEHTLSIAPLIREAGKACVIITKHWKPIPDTILPLMHGITVNTSVSALDSHGELEYRLAQHERLKAHCNPVLRIVSCRFNLDNIDGRERHTTQERLLSMGGIDTVFRPSPNNPFLVSGVIKAKTVQFLESKMLASIQDPEAYRGRCETGPDLCGLRSGDSRTKPPKPALSVFPHSWNYRPPSSNVSPLDFDSLFD